MPNSSSTGGYLVPAGSPAPVEDDALDDLFQAVVVAITGLAAASVRPRWQAVAPKQPEPGTDWCSIGVMESNEDTFPYIGHTPDGNGSDDFMAHEELGVLASFYGPNAKKYAGMLRDGLKIPQNTESLASGLIRWVSCGPVHTTPELFNQQWIHRQDMTIQFRRKVVRSYPVENLLVGDIHLFDALPSVDETIVVPPGSTILP